MNYGKIEETLHCLQQISDQVRTARILLSEILGEHEAIEDVAKYRRSLFRIVENNVISFPNVSRETKKEKSDVGTSDTQKQGFVNFTEKEILQMPKQFRKIFRTQKQTAHIRENNGSYEIRIQVNGCRISASGKYLDKAKERFIKKLKDYMALGNSNQRTEHFLIPYIEKWLDTVKKPYIKDVTFKMYTQALNAYIAPKFENRKIKTITQFELQAFINEFVHAGKNRTAEKIALLLSAVFDYAVDDGIIERSPMKRVIVARYEEEHGQSLTREEEKKLLSAFNDNPNEYAQAYVFMLYTGIRRGELASVELANGWISVVTGKQRKGVKEKTRRIPLCPILKRYLPKIDIERIKLISVGMLTKHIKDFLPSHHCHDLRHTFITRAQECGIKREIVSLWSGHSADSSITSTVYTHLEQNEVIQVKEMSLFSYDL